MTWGQIPGWSLSRTTAYSWLPNLFWKSESYTITLKIKYSDFTQQTRSKTLPYFISDKALLFETAKELLYQERMKNSVRLLGISLSNLNTELKKTIVVQLKFDF